VFSLACAAARQCLASVSTAAFSSGVGVFAARCCDVAGVRALLAGATLLVLSFLRIFDDDFITLRTPARTARVTLITDVDGANRTAHRATAWDAGESTRRDVFAAVVVRY